MNWRLQGCQGCRSLRQERAQGSDDVFCRRVAALSVMVESCSPRPVRRCQVEGVMDIVTPEERSRIMAAIKGKDTKPEMAVRKLVHRLGFRFRLHRRDLPGSPDIVFYRFRKVIFVHGCFWHRHPGCKYAYTPKSRAEFWIQKLEANVWRDAAAQEALVAAGWEVLVVWECETANMASLSQKIESFLSAALPEPSRSFATRGGSGKSL